MEGWNIPLVYILYDDQIYFFLPPNISYGYFQTCTIVERILQCTLFLMVLILILSLTFWGDLDLIVSVS